MEARSKSFNRDNMCRVDCQTYLVHVPLVYGGGGVQFSSDAD